MIALDQSKFDECQFLAKQEMCNSVEGKINQLFESIVRSRVEKVTRILVGFLCIIS